MFCRVECPLIAGVCKAPGEIDPRGFSLSEDCHLELCASGIVRCEGLG